MTSSFALQLFLRLIPSILFFVAAFLAVKDESVKQLWVELLIKAGSIRVDQTEDPKIRQGVRIPLLVLGGVLLIWPVLYLWKDSYAQMPLTVLPQPTAIPKPTAVPKTSGTPLPTPTPTLVPGQMAVQPQALPETSPPPASLVPTVPPNRSLSPESPSASGQTGGAVPLKQEGGSTTEARKPVPMH